jgi:hypothetical protein
MIALLVPSLMLMVMALQGGAVFGTATLALKLLKTTHWLAKITAMAASWLAWIAFTIGGYLYTGDSGGVMEGGAMVLLLCLACLISSLVYLVAWMLWPRRKMAVS